MVFFKTGPCFRPFEDIAPDYTPARRLLEMQVRAKSLLSERTQDELQEGSDIVAWLIEDHFFLSLERWVRHQVTIGFPTLDHLPMEERNEAKLRDIVSQTHGEDLPFENEDNTPELKALLQSCDAFDNFIDRGLTNEKFKDGKGYEYVAIHALEMIGFAIDEFTYGDGDTWQKNIHSDAPSYLVNELINTNTYIIEAVAIAEGMAAVITAIKRTETRLEKNHAALLTREAENLAKEKLSKYASYAATVRHKEMATRRDEVLKQWDNEANQYKNKSDFARIVGGLKGIKFRTLYDWITEHERSKS